MERSRVNLKSIDVINDSGKFTMYNEESCIYWVPTVKNNPDSCNIKITKDDGYVYDLFVSLYSAIASNSSIDSEKAYALFKDNSIEWHSDDFVYDAASVVTIKQDEEEDFDVVFKRSKIVSDSISPFSTLSVKFDKYYSRYKNYNKFFFDMYGKLDNYNSKFHIRNLFGKSRTRKR